MRQVDEATRRLEAALEEGTATAISCVSLVEGRRNHVSYHGRVRVRGLDEPVGPDTIFDLASLTKVLATTAVALWLHGRGDLDLERPVAELLPEFACDARAQITVRDLLAHRSGLPAHAAWWQDASLSEVAAPLFRPMGRQPVGADRLGVVECAREATWASILGAKLAHPRGTKALYSDAGFILLGLFLERLTGRSLSSLFGVEIARPLGLVFTRFVDEAAPLARPEEVAPTRRAPSRGGGLLRGQVDDDNAFGLGGIAGHAGLFGSAADVATFGQALLEAWDGEPQGPLRPASVRLFLTRDATPGSSRTLGFDTPSGPRSAAGRKMTRGETVGHLGYTGCSLWIDRARQRVVALLTNRVHCAELPEPIRRLRAEVHDLLI